MSTNHMIQAAASDGSLRESSSSSTARVAAAAPAMQKPSGPLLGWLLALLLLAIVPMLPAPFGTPFHLELGAKVLIMAIFALSLQLLVGFTGLVSLGHAAYFGFAAYMVVLLAPQSEAGNGWWLLAASVGGSALLALAIGALVLRTRGIYFIMVTLAFAQLVYFVFHDTDVGGGSDGAYIYFKPDFTVLGFSLLDLEKGSHFYWLCLALVAFTVGVLGLVLRARFGHALVGIRHNEQRMRAAGYDTLAYKLASFVLAGALAGIAGFLYSVQHGYVNPEILAWQQSGNALLMVILGGIGSLPGAIVGAFAFVLLAEWFQGMTKHWQLLMGGFIIIAVALAPQGLAGIAGQWRRRRAKRTADTGPALSRAGRSSSAGTASASASIGPYDEPPPPAVEANGPAPIGGRGV